MLKKIVTLLLPIADAIISPLTLISATLLWTIRRVGVKRMRVSRSILMAVGVFPVRDHYYEPLFNPKYLTGPLDRERLLPGIDMNLEEQLDILGRFAYNEELAAIPLTGKEPDEFYYHNESFGPGDAEYLYNIVRLFKPNRIIEIGSGNSTLMILNALDLNRREDRSYKCKHICIEPYEADWLEKSGVTVIRERVEKIDKGIFSELSEGDILFIDSSHVIRPQGDVLFEYLEILPTINPGVLVHIHDIFTPRDYTQAVILEDIRFWNEQYLLEAFLSCNPSFRIIGALDYLKRNHFAALSAKCPVLAGENHREPGSFWIVRN